MKLEKADAPVCGNCEKPLSVRLERVTRDELDRRIRHPSVWECKPCGCTYPLDQFKESAA